MLAVATALVAIFLLRGIAKAVHLQNALLIGAVMLIGEGLIELLTVRLGKIDVPDPRWRYFGGAALLWTAVALSFRRLAKAIARPWRKERVHWIWVMFLGALGTGAFQLWWPVLDPDFFMTNRVAGMAAVRTGGTLVLLGVLSPWFIRKRARHGRDFSDLADEPEDDAEKNTDQEAGHKGKIEAGAAALKMDVAGEPPKPAPPTAPQAGP